MLILWDIVVYGILIHAGRHAANQAAAEASATGRHKLYTPEPSCRKSSGARSS